MKIKEITLSVTQPFRDQLIRLDLTAQRDTSLTEEEQCSEMYIRILKNISEIISKLSQ